MSKQTSRILMNLSITDSSLCGGAKLFMIRETLSNEYYICFPKSIWKMRKIADPGGFLTASGKYARMAGTCRQSL
jgi:hypothetical protein